MTLHVRMVSPPDLTELLADALMADSGVSNLVVLTGSARHPDGDAVHFDVLARSANSVLRQVQALQGGHRGSIVIENVDAAIGEELGPATKQRLVQRDIAPVWDVVEAKIRSDAVYAPSFFILLIIAGLIGAVGILTNSQILIVGAMVVGPEYNPFSLPNPPSLPCSRQCDLLFGLAIPGQAPQAYSWACGPHLFSPLPFRPPPT